MSNLPTTNADTMLDAAPCVPSTTYYLSLHTADPGTTGAHEVTGGSYARQAITFGSAASGSQASTDSQSFTGMPAEAGGCPYFGVWSASTSGTFECGGSTSGLSGAIPSGATVTFSTGGVTLSVA